MIVFLTKVWKITGERERERILTIKTVVLDGNSVNYHSLQFTFDTSQPLTYFLGYKKQNKRQKKEGKRNVYLPWPITISTYG